MKLIKVPTVSKQSHSKRVTIVGEKYENRQVGLAKLYAIQEKHGSFNAELQEYVYKSSPAVRLMINRIDVGVFAVADADFFYKSKNSILGYNNLRIACEEEYAEDADDGLKTDRNGNPIVKSRTYKARLSLTIANKGHEQQNTPEKSVLASEKSVPVAEQSTPQHKEKGSFFSRLFNRKDK